MPTARRLTAAAATGDGVYVTGGLRGTSVTSASELYTAATDRWTTCKARIARPPRLAHASSVAH
jgi:hypothetical protein